MEAHPKLSDVFGVSKRRVLSYLEREAVDGLFQKAITTDRHVIVYGSSKQGKTSLVGKYLPYDANVVVSCTPKFESVDIYKSILKSLDIRIEGSSEKATGSSSKISATAKFKALLPFVGSGEAGMGGEIKDTTGEKVVAEPIEANLDLPQDVAHLLKRAKFNRFIILENFHYLSFDVQRTLAFDLRSFQELGIRFVILGVWREKNRLTQFNGDLQDRVVEVPVEPWSEGEFREVIRIGSECLNILIDDSIVTSLIASAFDSIGVVQELAKELCLASEVEQRQQQTKAITDTALLATAITKKTQDYSGRHLRALESIAEGRKAKKGTATLVPLYLPYYTIKAWLHFPFDQVVKGIRREQLEEQIKKDHHRSDDVRPSDMSNLLHTFAELQSDKGIVPPIFDYDQNTRTMRVVDSTFYFFLRHVDKDKVLKNIESPIDRRARRDQ